MSTQPTDSLNVGLTTLPRSLQWTQNFEKVQRSSENKNLFKRSGRWIIAKSIAISIGYFFYQVLLLQLQYFWSVLLTTLIGT